MTPNYLRWADAHHAAAKAEDALFRRSIEHLQGQGDAPSQEEAKQAEQLRAVAQEAFRAFLDEMAATSSRIRHNVRGTDFALRMTRQVAGQLKEQP